jgi:MscS family membrane protein
MRHRGVSGKGTLALLKNIVATMFFICLAVTVFLLMGTGPSLAQSPKCATPLRAVMEFTGNLSDDQHDPDAAGECFDFSEFSESIQKRRGIAIRLKKILDSRGLIIRLDDVPDKADAIDEKTGLPRFTLFPNQLPEVYLDKTGDRWLFSAASVGAVPELYQQTFSLGIEKYSDKVPSFLRVGVFGIAAWRYIALALLIITTLVAGRIIGFFVGNLITKAFRKRDAEWTTQAAQITKWPLAFIVMSALMAPILPELLLPARLNAILFLALKVIAVGFTVVIAYRLNDAFFDYLTRRADKTETRLDDQLVPLLRKAARLILILIGFLFVLQNLNVDIGSLMAGLGLGGLAFALAAKDTLANFFGSIMIFADRPFQIGDWVVIQGVEGTIEEVGFRSTRIRTFYKSLVTLPNAKVADAVVDNLGERTYRRLKMDLGLTYDTTPEQMQAFVEGVRAVLQANAKIWKDYYEVHFNNFGPSSLDVMVYAFLDVKSWTEELTEKHNILMEFLRLASTIGVSYAFPTQSLHVESMPGEASRPLSKEELIKTVQGFGPSGALGKPSGAPLTHGYHPGDTQPKGEDG